MFHSFSNDKETFETWLNLRCRHRYQVEIDFYCIKYAPFLYVILFVHYDDTISFVRFTYDNRVVLTEVAQGNLLFFEKGQECSVDACDCNKM